MQDINETLFKRLNALEKRLEHYYHLLLTMNELDFVMKGTYILEPEIEDIYTGQYIMEDSDE